MSIKHVSFDFWNTLAKGNKQFAEARKVFVADHLGLPLVDVEAVYRELKDGADREAEEHGIGLSSAQTYDRFMARLGRPCEDWTPLRNGMERLFREFPPIVLPENVEALQALQARGYTLSIGSNTNFIRGHTLNEVTISTLGVEWAYQVFSDEVQHSKPNDYFWKMVTDRAWIHTSTKPHEILHVGDNMICDGGCREADIQFAYVNGPAELAAVLKGVQ